VGAVIFKIPDEYYNCRYYFEFFISREGEFKKPDPLVKMKIQGNDILQSISLNHEYILSIRHFKMPKEFWMNNWEEDIEFYFYIDDKNIEKRAKIF